MARSLTDLLLQALQHSSMPGVAISRGTGELIYINDALLTTLPGRQRPDTLLEIFPAHVHPDLENVCDREETATLRYEQQESHYECRIVSAVIENEAEPTTVVLVSPVEGDARSLRAIGQVTGKYGHDFNNLLGSIQCSADLLDHKLRKVHGDDLPVARQLALIQSAIQKAVRLTGQMRGYARIDESFYAPLSLAVVLSQAIEVVQAVDPKGCECSVTIEDEVPVHGNEFQLVQAVQSILLNSLDAMKTQPERHLLVVVRQITEQSGVEGNSRDRWMQILCIDHGRGMDAETARLVFEPFFSTRPTAIGAGLGLGLPMARQIFREHGGELRISSAPGGGTAVEILLPPYEEGKA